ncbi:hypothetical protein ACLKA6_013165 [Drosophila palustris]
MLEIPATVWMVTKVVQSNAMLKPASVQVIMEIDGLVFHKTRALVITSNGSFLLIHDPSSEIPASVWMVTKVVQFNAMLKLASVQVIMEIDGLVFHKTRALVITSNGSLLLIHDPSSVIALMTFRAILKELVP